MAAEYKVTTRAIQMWAQDGCPHQSVRNGSSGDKRVLMFDPEQVSDWVRANGRDAASRVKAATVRQFDLSKHLATESDAPLSDQMEDTSRALLASLREGPVGAAELRNIVQTLKACAQEVRAAEEARSKREARAARLVQRDVAERMLVSEARMFTADLETMAAELPRRLMLTMEQESVKPGDTEGIQRLLTKLIRQQVDVMREHRADSIERALAGAVEEYAA